MTMTSYSLKTPGAHRLRPRKARLVMDIETTGLNGEILPPVLMKIEPGEETYTLRFMDPEFDRTPGAHYKDHLIERQFKHLGAAIVWARRRLFLGEVSGDFIELVIDFNTPKGRIGQEVFDIRLGTIIPWAHADHFGYNGRNDCYQEEGIKRCRPKNRRHQ
ncbi:hypothetical protein BAJUN_00200 [Bajunvirus bajun]|uniref:Uncharacterized protein n=1 Tax=Brevundimonas phage vB_BgoS-Bajun TaxID=2948594 RepID=A0A9E7N626_9CAUD|nr:hypothetical protein BAJUN_00200 [Brevundimonas phage vB_BgoS-Bajun]